MAPGAENGIFPGAVTRFCDDLLLAIPYAGAICVDPVTGDVIGYLDVTEIKVSSIQTLLKSVTEQPTAVAEESLAVHFNCLIDGSDRKVTLYPQSRLTRFDARSGPELNRYLRLRVVSSRSRVVSGALRALKADAQT
jgi:hypothetical protein